MTNAIATTRLNRATRQYSKTYRRVITEGLAGGLKYGCDWPTLRIVDPAGYEELRAVTSELRAAQSNFDVYAFA